MNELGFRTYLFIPQVIKMSFARSVIKFKWLAPAK